MDAWPAKSQGQAARPHTEASKSSHLQAVMADLNMLCYGNEAGITES